MGNRCYLRYPNFRYDRLLAGMADHSEAKEGKDMKEYSCGCRPGNFLCQEAVRRWRIVGQAYSLAIIENTDTSWKCYEEALRHYKQHGEEVADVSE